MPFTEEKEKANKACFRIEKISEEKSSPIQKNVGVQKERFSTGKLKEIHS
jgi:hypothetical protein